MTHTFLDPDMAAAQLSAALTGRRHHIVIGLVSHALAEALTDIPTWTAYLQAIGRNLPILTIDNTTEETAEALELLGMLTPLALVLTVPKHTVPASTLRAAFGDNSIPDDGSRDVIFLDSYGDGLYRWPTLLVDAIAVDDPASAAAIRLGDVASQN